MLKRETTNSASLNFLQPQQRFDTFVHLYNNERPHQTLGGTRLGGVYILYTVAAYPSPAERARLSVSRPNRAGNPLRSPVHRKHKINARTVFACQFNRHQGNRRRHLACQLHAL